MTLKESPYQTAATKTGEILARELFLDTLISSLVFVVLLRYVLFHLLSASSVVGLVCWTPFPYYRSRHFSLENSAFTHYLG